MGKFDYRKWVTEQKWGGDKTSPREPIEGAETACQQMWAPCHLWEECINGAPSGIEEVRHDPAVLPIPDDLLE